MLEGATRSHTPLLVGLAVMVAIGAVLAPMFSPAPRRAPTPAAPSEPPVALPALDAVVRGEGAWTVIVLHGYGAPGDDLVPLAETLAARAPARYVIPAAPLAMPDGVGRMWFPVGTAATADEVSAARAHVEALIDAEIARGTPADHVIVGGFSQGGILSISLALAGRHRLGGIFVLSGRALPHAPSDAARLASLPIFESHGQNDARIPFAEGEAFAAEARAARADLTFVPFVGPHTIPPEVAASLGQWLAARVRS
jgi:phospholipase/carboxylesterase